MSGYVGYNPIVQVNVFEQLAPQPNRLQRTGAFVSQGGTNLPKNTYSLLTSPASLTPLIPSPLSLTGITQSAGLATAVTAAPHGFTISDTIFLTISGATGATTAYNGTFLCTITTTSDFTFAIASGTTSPATGTLFYTPGDVTELENMVTTFFANGQGVSPYVLELGAGNATDGQTDLAAWITANPFFFYSYLLPKQFGVSSTFYSSFALNYISDEAKIYFHVSTTLAYWQANPTLFAATLKCLIVTIPAPSVGTTEFTAAAGFYVTLNINPSPANQVTQAAYSFLSGVTPYPTLGNQSLFQQLETANINIVGTGAEGGISNAIWFYGATLDGNDFNKFWYSVDNVQINLDVNTANFVINGSNNPLSPLNYNQQGINSIQAVAVSTMRTEIATSLALGTLIQTQLDGTTFAQNLANGLYVGNVVVNAIPFAIYAALEPSNYGAGLYDGISVAYAVQLGFRKIIYNVTVSNFG